jgi:hypothetical protein
VKFLVDSTAKWYRGSYKYLLAGMRHSAMPQDAIMCCVLDPWHPYAYYDAV